MRDKVCLYVRVAATQEYYEFRIPYDLAVADVAALVSRLLQKRLGRRFAAAESPRLMGLDGSGAGELLDSDVLVRTLVARGELLDGSRVALV